MDFVSVFIKMIELFLIIIIGYGAYKVKYIDGGVKVALTKLILNITMPCTILASVMTATELPEASMIIKLLFIATIEYAIYFVIAKATSKVLRLTGSKKAVAEFAIMFANVGFVGFPVTNAVFGEASTFYTMIFNLPFNVLCYSLGVYLLQQGDATEEEKEFIEELPVKSRVNKIFKLFMTPAMISSVIALVLAFTRVHTPAVIADTCDIIGKITTPGALIIIGCALAQMPLKEMFGDIKAYLFTIICVIVTPAIVYLCYFKFVTEPLAIGEAVIMAGLPVATAGTMLCVEYGGDEKFMAQITFLTTLVSVITIPVIAVLL